MDLNKVSKKHKYLSIHLSDFPVADETLINKDLEERMELAQKISSMALSLRKKNNLRVRQPLNKIMIPVLNPHFRKVVSAVEDLILSEINVKEIEYLTEDSGVLVKRIKPNFKSLGPKYGKFMKQIAAAVNQFSQDDIKYIEKNGIFKLVIADENIDISLDDVEISTQDIPGWSVANQDDLTVALDITITDNLQKEGLARELVNRIQNYRKDTGFEVTDRIKVKIAKSDKTDSAFTEFKDYICIETLASIEFDVLENINEAIEFILIDDINTFLKIEKE